MKTLDPTSVVIRAYNPSDIEVKVEGITFAPHASSFVSFLWMRNRYGDPRSKQAMGTIVKLPGSDTAMAIQPRETELARINTVWGIPHVGGWDTITPLEFYVDDERLFTVYDDPSGLTTAPHSESEATFAAQQDRITKLEQTLDAVLKATGVSRENLPFDIEEPAANIPEDDSTTSRTTSPWASAEPIDALLKDDGDGMSEAI